MNISFMNNVQGATSTVQIDRVVQQIPAHRCVSLPRLHVLFKEALKLTFALEITLVSTTAGLS